MSNVLKVAIIGASGIGKNHARWLHQHGCEVVAFVGSSKSSVEKTREVLRQGFGFSGRGYDDVSEMLRQEKPDAVCVSSLPPLHFAQAMQCLQSGAHVLCEKPLVYDAQKSSQQLIEEAQTLAREAAARSLILGAQTQYAVTVPELLQLAGLSPDSKVRRFGMEMETKNLKHGRDFEQIWIDLSPHPLSVLQKLAPGSDIIEDSIDCTVGERETSAKFEVAAGGDKVSVDLKVRFNPDAKIPKRRFWLDEKFVDYAGRNNQNGEFRTYLSNETGDELELPDLVDILIGKFVAACNGAGKVAVSGEAGAQNVAWQLEILERARRV